MIIDPLKIRWPRVLWDRNSKRYFCPKSVTFSLNSFDTAFGLTQRDLLELSGAPSNSTVYCNKVGSDVLRIVVENDNLFVDPLEIHIVRAKNNQLVGRLEYLNVREGRAGVGSRILICVARAASRLQFNRLESLAIGGVETQTRAGHSWMGAVFAAKLGFDGKLSSDVVERLPVAWEDVRGLRELLSQPAGEVWWSKNVQSTEVTFDVSSRSLNMRILRTYTVRKGIRIFQCFTHPTFN